ncbi:extracellular solute-binding protein [Microbacterium marinilacus]|uniref:Sugar ABC transporter substrate-binding protein n=1 Tax=Microbacterium marinilacus TaxID=415209 RepID=A0ABP7BEL0_9MICO|nr:extracellular solute-binding protein [Microbacterium marinilacus]MBY0689325.1 extracellular solute-binding protein [Microbacterium marinilacus]
MNTGTGKKALAGIGLLGVGSLVLAGCAGGSDDGDAPAAETGEVTVWVVGTDTPDTARDYLKETFESENEGWTLRLEEKTWADVSETYVAALQSNDTPDVVEVGNTQAIGFIDQGLFSDLSDIRGDLGDLNPGLEEAGTYDGAFYAAPYYAGGRVVFYSPEIVDGDSLPATLEEYVDAGIEMRTDTVSGIYAPGRDWYNMLPYIWTYGGEIAVQDGDTWDAQFSSDESLQGLELLQKVYAEATNAPKDGNETDAHVPFCAGEVAFLSAPAWMQWSILAEADAENPGCPDTYGKDLGAFPLPGATEGETAPIFAGGSNIGVAALSENQAMAKEVVKIMLSSGYQDLMAEGGLTPALLDSAASLPDTPVAQAQAEALANSKGVPTSPNWAEVESSLIIQDSLVRIAQGEDVKAVAEKLDTDIEAILNG